MSSAAPDDALFDSGADGQDADDGMEDPFLEDGLEDGNLIAEVEVLRLRALLQARDVEISQLRARLESQVLMLDQLQQELCETCVPAAASDCGPLHRAPPLVMAATEGDTEALQALVRGDPRILRDFGEMALLAACQHGRVCTADTLLALGVDVHTEHDSPLLWACTRGDTRLARALLARGANPSALNQCSLRIATRQRDVPMIELLAAEIAARRLREDSARRPPCCS